MDALRTLFTVRLHTMNDAARSPEDLAQILRDMADRVESGTASGLVRDINGNRIGAFLWSAREDITASD